MKTDKIRKETIKVCSSLKIMIIKKMIIIILRNLSFRMKGIYLVLKMTIIFKHNKGNNVPISSVASWPIIGSPYTIPPATISKHT